MKIKQERMAFKPITIVVESVEEARAFLEIMDEVDARTPEAQRLAVAFSNAFTNGKVDYPVEETTEYLLGA